MTSTQSETHEVTVRLSNAQWSYMADCAARRGTSPSVEAQTLLWQAVDILIDFYGQIPQEILVNECP